MRKSCRRRGFGLQMLEDFCSSFTTEEFLGVSSPLSASMVKACRRFLQQHEEHRERLYEVEAPGGWTQRRNIWLNIQLGRYSLHINEESGPTSAERQKNEGSTQRTQTSNCGPDLTSVITCAVSVPVTGSSEEQIKPCDPSQGGSSPSSKISGTGCCPAAHADDTDSGPPTTPPQSPNSKQALISKPSLSAELCTETREGEETRRSAKRVRRT